MISRDEAVCSSHPPTVRSVDADLVIPSCCFLQADIAELVWRCAVYEPDVEMLKASSCMCSSADPVSLCFRVSLICVQAVWSSGATLNKTIADISNAS